MKSREAIVVLACGLYLGVPQGTMQGEDVPGVTIDRGKSTMAAVKQRAADLGSGVENAGTARQLSQLEAIKSAASGLGLKDLAGVNVQATLERFPERILPFVGRQLAGRTTWRVNFEGLDLGRDGAESQLRNPHIRRIAVYLSPDSGRIVSVVSDWPKDVARTAEYPPLDAEEKQLKAAGCEYTGLPTEAPAVSLLEALVSEDVVFWSSDVKQIRAYYVKETNSTHSDRPVWVIQLWGFEPFEISPPRGVRRDAVPENARNHIRNVVDARTGEWLGADTVPQPVTK